MTCEGGGVFDVWQSISEANFVKYWHLTQEARLPVGVSAESTSSSTSKVCSYPYLKFDPCSRQQVNSAVCNWKRPSGKWSAFQQAGLNLISSCRPKEKDNYWKTHREEDNWQNKCDKWRQRAIFSCGFHMFPSTLVVAPPVAPPVAGRQWQYLPPLHRRGSVGESPRHSGLSSLTPDVSDVTSTWSFWPWWNPPFDTGTEPPILIRQYPAIFIKLLRQMKSCSPLPRACKL
jgi:hypothetical protein